VAGLFGPESGTTSSHVQSICDAMEIPHIETRWDYLNKRDDYSINLYPSPKQISKVRKQQQILHIIIFIIVSMFLFIFFRDDFMNIFCVLLVEMG
jgi:hypothetical protein